MHAFGHRVGVRNLDAPGISPEREKLVGDLRRRQDDVDLAGGDGARRHAVVLGVGRRLRDDDAAMLLQARDAGRSVAAGAREHDADRPLAVGLGQGAEEVVDDDVATAGARRLRQAELAVGHRQLVGRRDDVDVVALDLCQAGDLGDTHRRRGLQDRRGVAFVVRRQVQHHDEGHVGRCRQALEKDLDRRQAAGRSADADHRESQPAVGGQGFALSVGVHGWLVHSRA